MIQNVKELIFEPNLIKIKSLYKLYYTLRYQIFKFIRFELIRINRRVKVHCIDAISSS